MSMPTLPRILGYNLQATLVTGSGSVSMSLVKQIDLDETPTKKGVNVNASTQEEKMFTKNDCKLSFKGARGLTNCYSDLPREKQRITDIQFAYVDEDGNPVAGEDLPTDLATKYANWAVASKKASQGEDDGTYDLELEAGFLNAVD